MAPDIRQATEGDIPQLIPLFADLYKGDLGEHFEEILGQYLAGGGHCVFVGLIGGRIVGVLVGSHRLDIDYECRAGFVDALIVAEEHRRQGIGRLLLSRFEEWARGKGCTALQVLNCNREFFEHRGFRERPAVLHQVEIDELRA